MTYQKPQLSDQSLFKCQAYIGGQWVDARTGDTFEVQDPATGKTIATMPDMDEDDVKAAIDCAYDAFWTFRKVVPRERGRMLRRWYDLIMANAHDLATLVTLENGKTFDDALSEVKYAAAFVEWFSEEAPRLYGETVPANVNGRRVYTIREPVGVCGLITPWNWPAGTVTHKIGPALAAGCTVVLKSPGETPFTSAALTVLAERAGIPKGVINVVTTGRHTSDVGKALCTSPKVKKVSITGSTRVGKILMAQAAGTLKKLSFELGGNAPFMVFSDANLERAVRGAIECKFRSSGQTCVCANRLYVQRDIYDAFTTAFIAEVGKFKLGSGFDKQTTHGPLISERAVAKSEEHIEDAIRKGATLLAGGKRRPDLGPNYMDITVLGDMNSDMMLAHDETFGPVAGLFPFDTENDVVALANDADVGLAGYFFSKDVARCYRVAEALQVGMVGVNTGLISDVAMPFGGVKESGFGREGSKHGMAEYTTLKSVTIGNLDD